ncbi:Ktr system potassium uptake protein B [Aedoeadaptatus ivorii]|uniref:Ktr system potassium uptake protein B n=1 Tax=Aedoeadaptatus ivorii TaxID=54006 RepID=A0A3S4YVI2_9FIRM|nr:TrkH family potassium uptake protein [Peptoniphilus ivorii]MDQ0508915.1 trk system potassium uptake protein TrkH [Peptoniphilus ivorii]VEJ35741.1 Ktr system potassium uptake protein B [Peptoniphilus ivorii]
MKIWNHIQREVLKNPPLVLGISFMLLISMGTLLLMLPFASSDGNGASFIDALFTATSASCVTGLIVRNTAVGWSVFGKFVIISLIQIGGLGTMTIIALVSVLLGKKIGLRERMFIREQLNTNTLSGMVRLIEFVIRFTFVVEGIGALLLSLRLVPAYGLFKGVVFSVFHAISAFCNAGFDLFGNSMIPFQGDYLVTLTIAALIILGGLGFIVYVELWQFRQSKHLSSHTKLVLSTTAMLLLGGMFLIYFFEFRNPATLGALPEQQKWLAAFFQSTTFRTAGFNSVEMGSMNDITVFFAILLMFIGGSPGSTAGGLKTTTFAITMAAAFTTLKGTRDTELFKRRVSETTIRKIFALFVIAICLVFFVASCIVFFEHNKFVFVDILFETVSAFGTVGVTRGITADLSPLSKLFITFTMYLGRVGPTTFAMGLFQKEHDKKYRYAEGRFIVG